MRAGVWGAFFVVSNIMGLEAFKAAVTLPWEEAMVPALVSLPLIGLTAFAATRVLAAWRNED